MDLKKELTINETKSGICNECKECSNYFVSEIGCYGNNKPCEDYCIH